MKSKNDVDFENAIYNKIMDEAEADSLSEEQKAAKTHARQSKFLVCEDLTWEIVTLHQEQAFLAGVRFARASNAK